MAQSGSRWGGRDSGSSFPSALGSVAHQLLGQHLTQIVGAQAAPQPATKGDGYHSRFFADDDDQGVGLVADPDRRAVAVAEAIGRPADQQHACCSMKAGRTIEMRPRSVWLHPRAAVPA